MLRQAVTLRAQGRLQEAERICEAVLADAPRDFDALHLSGVLKHQQGRLVEALHFVASALREKPGAADALAHHGIILEALERHDEALASFDLVLAVRAGDAMLHRKRGEALAHLGRHDEALASYDRALELAPELGVVHFNRAVVLAALDRHDAALAGFDRAIALAAGAIASPGFGADVAADRGIAEAHYNRGTILIRLERFDEARTSFDQALALQPDYVAALGNRAVALAALGRYDDALADYDRALRLAPDFTDAHNNRGNTFLALNRLDEALGCYAAVLALDPEHADAHFNAAMTRLCGGDFRGAWKHFDYRWRRRNNPVPRPSFAAPMWRGEEKDLRGKTVLLCAEQGLGDAIQFVRYAPMVAALGAKVVLHVRPALRAIVATVDGVAEVTGEGEVLPRFDLYCPLLSLPAAFDTELETIPAGVPYIRPFATHIALWRERLPEQGRLRVGLCWAGSGSHVNNRRRSIALPQFAKILSVPDVDFVSLQKDVDAAEAALLAQHGVVQLGQAFRDFADTAAVVAQLDLVISVDTSVAHLAGAMGKAVGMLVPFAPDWRWMLDRPDSPWYPTMRLFRQASIGDWSGPVEQIWRELDALSRRRAAALGEHRYERISLPDMPTGYD